MSTPTSDFNDVQLIGNQNYGFQISINDIENTNDPIPLYQQGIGELVIIERFDYLTGPTEGYITFLNGNEGFQNDEYAYSENQTPLMKELFSKGNYLFRNDGRDILSIYIKPLAGDSKDNPQSEEYDDSIWSIKYTFSIRDYEDILGPNNATKAKRLYFWDIKYQFLKEKNSNFSTAVNREETDNIKNVEQISNDSRSMYTGDAIKQALLANNIIDYVDTDNFEQGFLKIFYTSPTDTNVLSDIEYLMKYHLSAPENVDKGPDLSILSYDRFKQQLTLRPLSWYFKQAGNDATKPGKFQLEHLFVEKNGDIDITPKPILSPIKFDNTINDNIDINMLDYNKISLYKFVDMAGYDNSRVIVSQPTYTYDFKTKKYILNQSNNNVKHFKDKLKELYLSDSVYGKNPSPLITLNKTKLENQSVNPDWIHQENTTFAKYRGLKQLLYSGVFLNQCINFWLKGSTHRIPGRFYAIDKDVGADGKLAYKLYGQWLCTEVKHVFGGKLGNNYYANNITAVKVHSYDELGISEDVI